MTAAANSEIDRRRYGRLLARVLPTVVKTEEENERMLAEIERLSLKNFCSSALKANSRPQSAHVNLW